MGCPTIGGGAVEVEDGIAMEEFTGVGEIG